MPCGGRMPVGIECEIHDDTLCRENGCAENQVYHCGVDYGLYCKYELILYNKIKKMTGKKESQ